MKENLKKSRTLFLLILALSVVVIGCNGSGEPEQSQKVKTPAELAADSERLVKAEQKRLDSLAVKKVEQRLAAEKAEAGRSVAEAAAAKAEADRLVAEAKAETDRLAAAIAIAAAEKEKADRLAAEADATRQRKIKERLAAEAACQCKPKTFRSRSDHTWVEFRLPQGTDNLKIQIQGGAHNKYVFPKCNRVYWSDLTFECDCGTWKKTSGNWDADALCHGSKGNSEYVFVGEH